MHTSSAWYVPSTLYIIRACFFPLRIFEIFQTSLPIIAWARRIFCTTTGRQIHRVAHGEDNASRVASKKKGLWSWGHVVTSENQPSLIYIYIYTISQLMHKSVCFANGWLWGIDFEAETNSTQLELEVSRGHTSQFFSSTKRKLPGQWWWHQEDNKVHMLIKLWHQNQKKQLQVATFREVLAIDRPAWRL